MLDAAFVKNAYIINKAGKVWGMHKTYEHQVTPKEPLLFNFMEAADSKPLSSDSALHYQVFEYLTIKHQIN